LGPAVTDAAEWYEKSRWIGVVGTPQASFLINKVAAIHEYVESTVYQQFVEYDVPIKGQKSVSLQAISWPDIFIGKDDKKIIEPKIRFLEYISKIPIPYGEEDIYQNTNII